MKHFLLLTLIIAMLPFSIAQASIIEHGLSLKVEIKMNHVNYEWSYINPDEYRYIKGNRIIKGKAAERKVEGLFSLLNLSEQANVEEMVAVLQKNGYKNIQSLDIRFINQKNQLYTWVWHRKN